MIYLLVFFFFSHLIDIKNFEEFQLKAEYNKIKIARMQYLAFGCV